MLFEGWSVLWRTLVVCVLAYATLVFLLRATGKRTLSKWNAFDFVVTVALGSTLATALLSRTTSWAQSAFAFGLLVSLQFVITSLSVRSASIRRWIKARPTLLLHRGRFIDEALRQERVTEGEVRAAVRARGYAALESVEAVVLETDGGFSVITHAGEHAASAMEDVRGYPRHPHTPDLA